MNKIGYEHDPKHPLADPVMFCIVGTFMIGLLSPLGTALVLVLTTSGQAGLPKKLAKVLSSRPLAKLADLSYDIYLVHPLVRLFLKIRRVS